MKHPQMVVRGRSKIKNPDSRYYRDLYVSLQGFKPRLF
jgi:hypothetical protein